MYEIRNLLCPFLSSPAGGKIFAVSPVYAPKGFNSTFCEKGTQPSLGGEDLMGGGCMSNLAQHLCPCKHIRWT